MNDPLYTVERDGDDDYISELGMERIAEFVATIPPEFEHPSTQASRKSIVATFRFPGEDITAQMVALDRIVKSATLVPTLHANLVAARAEIAQLRSRIDRAVDFCGVVETSGSAAIARLLR